MSLKDIISNTFPKCPTATPSWDHFLAPTRGGKEDPKTIIADLRKLGAVDTPPPLPPVTFDPKVFTLKNLKVLPSASQETACFTADIWFKGKKVGLAENSGHGGDTRIDPVWRRTDVEKESEEERKAEIAKRRAALQEAEEWALTLPPSSTFERAYSCMLGLDESFAGKKLLEEENWSSPTATDLEGIVHAIACRKLDRMETKGLGSLVVFGPGDGRETPSIMKFQRAIKEEQLEPSRAARKHAWYIKLTDFLDVPYHYYPCPHPYAFRLSSWAPLIMHLPTQKVGKVGGTGTTDEVVEIQFVGPDDEADYGKVIAKPEELEFITREDAKKFVAAATPEKAKA